jgi:hypothetical protein
MKFAAAIAFCWTCHFTGGGRRGHALPRCRQFVILAAGVRPYCKKDILGRLSDQPTQWLLQ